jgi:hypothetical protein
MEHIDDEYYHNHNHQYVDKAADIRGIPLSDSSNRRTFFFKMSPPEIKNAGGRVSFVPASSDIYNFHDTHFSIWDLLCKSQSCAKLGMFCANVVAKKKIEKNYEFCNNNHRLIRYCLQDER